MNVFKRLRRRWRLGAVFALAVSVAIGYSWPGQASAEPTRVPVFGALDLADAVLFNVGPADAYLAALHRQRVPWTDATTTSQRAVHEAISGDRRWSSSFAARLQSGDPVKVEAAMSDLGTLTRRVLDDTFGRDRVDDAIRLANDAVIKDHLIKANAIDYQSALDVGAEVWFETDVAVAFEVAVAVVVVVLAVFAWDTPDEAAQMTQLEKEVVVKTISEKLQAGGAQALAPVR